MTWEQFRSIVWLRWRLNMNRWKRAGKLNAIIMIVFVVAACIVAAGSFFLAIGLGAVLFPRAEPDVRLLVFAGLVLGFLSFWILGLLTELQRDDALSLENLLHYPISLSGAFLLNYLTSLVSFSLIIFVPLTCGLIISLIATDGAASLLLVPLFVSFLLMVTGVTYRFRGWLMVLMANKRRRRTVTVAMVLVVVCFAQLPLLLNMYVIQPAFRDDSPGEEEQALSDQVANGEITSEEYVAALSELQETRRVQREQKYRSAWETLTSTAGWASAILPIGWFPYGVRALAQGVAWPALAGTLAAGAIGIYSLWRAYQTTLRFYTAGGQASRPRRLAGGNAAPGKPAADRRRKVLLVERTLGPIPRQAAAIAWTNLAMLIRAPEGKMMLASPIIMVVIFGSMLLGGGVDIPVLARPFVGLAAVSFPMMGMAQLVINQFGFDRHGFRLFVLSPSPRSEILLGKNLSLAPLVAGICVLSVTLVQIFIPMSAMHYLATLAQIPATFMLLCMVGNLTSIFSPLAIKAGTFQAAKPTGTTILIHAAATIACPFAILPGAVCLAVSLAIEVFLWPLGGVTYLLFSLACLAAVAGAYRVVLRWEGDLFQHREQKILDLITVSN